MLPLGQWGDVVVRDIWGRRDPPRWQVGEGKIVCVQQLGYKVTVGPGNIGFPQIRHGPIEKPGGKTMQSVAELWRLHVHQDKALVCLSPLGPVVGVTHVYGCIEWMKQDGVKRTQITTTIGRGPTIRHGTLLKDLGSLAKQKVGALPKFGVVQDAFGIVVVVVNCRRLLVAVLI